MSKVQQATEQAKTELKSSFLSLMTNSIVFGAMIGAGIWFFNNGDTSSVTTPIQPVAQVQETPKEPAIDYGKWLVFDWVDEFGDATGEKGMRIESRGLFSNSATKPRTLKIMSYYSEYSWGSSISFKFQEYEYKGYEKGVFDQADWNCLIKNTETGAKVYRFTLVVYKGDTMFHPATSNTVKIDGIDTNLSPSDWLIQQVKQEQQLEFVCSDKYSTTYVFDLDARGFNNSYNLKFKK